MSSAEIMPIRAPMNCAVSAAPKGAWLGLGLGLRGECQSTVSSRLTGAHGGWDEHGGAPSIACRGIFARAARSPRSRPRRTCRRPHLVVVVVAEVKVVEEEEEAVVAVVAAVVVVEEEEEARTSADGPSGGQDHLEAEERSTEAVVRARERRLGALRLQEV